MWDQYYIPIANTHPATHADVMEYCRHELTSTKNPIQAMKDANTDIKKKHIREWQSQLLAVEVHLRCLGQLPSLELNINFTDVGGATPSRAMVPYHQLSNQVL